MDTEQVLRGVMDRWKAVPTVSTYLGVLVTRGDDGWRIAFYQTSQLDRF